MVWYCYRCAIVARLLSLLRRLILFEMLIPDSFVYNKPLFSRMIKIFIIRINIYINICVCGLIIYARATERDRMMPARHQKSSRTKHRIRPKKEYMRKSLRNKICTVLTAGYSPSVHSSFPLCPLWPPPLARYSSSVYSFVRRSDVCCSIFRRSDCDACALFVSRCCCCCCLHFRANLWPKVKNNINR